MTKKKKVAIIGSVGLPANYGGFETMVFYLTKEKGDEFDITVFCENVPKEQRIQKYHGCTLRYLPFKANGAQSIVYDVSAIFLSWFKYDTLLILGTPGCLVLPFLNIFRKTKTVINFGGLEWKRDKWGAFGKWYLKLTEKIAVNQATVMVADNQHFIDYVHQEYSKPSLLIEYGGDHTSAKEKNTSLIAKYPFLTVDYDVSVSRAQVDNNLHLVLEAYTQLPQRNLVLVSNYDKFEYGRELKIKYAGYPNIYMQDAVYDLHELDVIRSNAQLYIHSHTFCGTAPSLVEAMNLNLPIMAFNVPTNHFTTEEKAFYFSDAKDLVEILKNISQNGLNKNAESMKAIAEGRYTWALIANKYAKLF
ncbi:DUF1972 domain-containing protein [Maribacter sp. PR1]|uniref:DUF1972 domain-containing protein n=1 Tax=Maribacter cobaltidurans TaxID=1178778 RepID=A0ABU7IVZ5_9FLAO|nr:MULTISPECIES: DUF1972 domain-containing protein [Maribacter]MDC6389775.1 DUF1972 domain-containing protein [Maribacter sp. PR1]MEE1977165.1 DUF1972 domain-containing protein [Maribacter cobaltidurans]